MNMVIMYLHVSDDPKQEKKTKKNKNVNAVILQKPLDGASDQQSHGGDQQMKSHVARRQITQLTSCGDGTKNIWKKYIYIYLYIYYICRLYIYFSKRKYGW